MMRTSAKASVTEIHIRFQTCMHLRQDDVLAIARMPMHRQETGQLLKHRGLCIRLMLNCVAVHHSSTR